MNGPPWEAFLPFPVKKRLARPIRVQGGEPDGQTALLEGAESSTFVLNDFHRSETKDGRKLWEIRAVKGQYFPERNEAKLHDAKLWLYKNENPDNVITLDATEALISFEGPSLDKAVLSKGVTVVQGGKIKIETDDATYKSKERTIFAPGFVRITSDLIQITGEVLHGDLETQEFKIEREVSSVITPKKGDGK